MNQSDEEFDQLTLEVVSEKFAGVYKNVTLAVMPMYRWLQIVNDVTILLEETRRGAQRQKQALERALKVLMRLLDFTGFYLRVLPEATDANRGLRGLADFVARCLRSPSYTEFLDKGDPEEGPTRWILAKYPDACAKCGRNPCACPLTPWVFEERRQNPGPFLPFRAEVIEARNRLRERWGGGGKDLGYFTLPSLLASFARIYRNSYYHQDIWKIVMHLSEEVGEATTELSRLELLFFIKEQRYALDSEERWTEIDRQGRAIISERLGPPANDAKKDLIAQTQADMVKELRTLKDSKDPVWGVATLVSAKVKEEIADVFSWLSATIYQLYKACNEKEVDADGLYKLLEDYKYIKRAKHLLLFTCPNCTEHDCKDDCLVEHAVAAELYEKVALL